MKNLEIISERDGTIRSSMSNSPMHISPVLKRFGELNGDVMVSAWLRKYSVNKKGTTDRKTNSSLITGV